MIFPRPVHLPRKDRKSILGVLKSIDRSLSRIADTLELHRGGATTGSAHQSFYSDTRQAATDEGGLAHADDEMLAAWEEAERKGMSLEAFVEGYEAEREEYSGVRDQRRDSGPLGPAMGMPP